MEIIVTIQSTDCLTSSFNKDLKGNGEMKKLSEITAALDQMIPREVIAKRDGGGGRKLDYLEGWYVIDRLNKVFGPLGWMKQITDVRLLDTPKPSYLVKVVLTVFSQDGSSKTSEGYGYGSDKSSMNPHELAIKEAVTDALKVAAKDLGMSMGLALYDKTQEFVDDGQKEETKIQEQKAKSTEPRSGVRPSAGSNDQSNGLKRQETASHSTTSVEGKETPKVKVIASTALAITHKFKHITKEKILAYFDQTFSIKDITVTDVIMKLTAAQQDQALSHLEGVLNGKDL